MVGGVSDGAVNFHADVSSGVSIIPGIIDTPVPPSGTAAPAEEATPRPTSNASGIAGAGGGTAQAEDTLQLILAGAIAAVITAIILYVFNNMSKLRKNPAEKVGEKPAAKPEPKLKPKPRPAARPVKAVKEKAPGIPKKSEDISQDYIYGLVMGNVEKGNVENEEDRPRARK